ncbi:hypothetical protein SCRM01_018 [Synechococcus phage S-CRM01]|uniref:tail fiber protein n=1 Tax=Synechococcus phage S-CRM01 TaxID=1026955 RepID=UPI000209E33C|nr:tail fiber protein [Synechococcus phage S-CRM01]AEC52965.1 hypothetical protein SCRM01_018 [Synechococcus phage S-CRM01]
MPLQDTDNFIVSRSGTNHKMPASELVDYIDTANEALYVNIDGDTMTGNLNLPSQNGGQLAGFRNVLINGAMNLNFRYGLSVTPGFTGGLYVTDRWAATATGAALTSQTLVTDQRARQVIYGAAGNTGATFLQRIESVNALALRNRDVTLSVDLAHSSLTTVTWTAFYPNTNDVFTTWNTIATGTFTVNSTLTRYSATFNMGDFAWRGVEIRFTVAGMGAGTTWTIRDAQLEPGTVATPFERRDYGLECLLSHRYFFNGITGANLNPNSTTANISFNAFFPVIMRTVPTISGWTPSFVNLYGWTGFQNTLGFNWAGNIAYRAEAEL